MVARSLGDRGVSPLSVGRDLCPGEPPRADPRPRPLSWLCCRLLVSDRDQHLIVRIMLVELLLPELVRGQTVQKRGCGKHIAVGAHCDTSRRDEILLEQPPC